MHSAVIPARRRSPQDTAGRAHRVLDAALGVAGEWGHCHAAAKAATALNLALEEYGLLERGDVHWESAYPHLRDVADPDGEALEKAAEEAALAAAILLMTIAATCGRELADDIKDTAAITPEDKTGPQISPAGRADAPHPTR